MEQKLTITDHAASRIRELVAAEKSDQPLKLRITISGGGCSGFQYAFALDDSQATDDVVFSHADAGVIVDALSFSLINEAVLDYVSELVGESFVIKNPNAASSCGCGNSFSI